MHIYDYIVIGSGLAGLSVATKISKETKNILLIDSESTVGGSNKFATLKYPSKDKTENIITENGLRFFPGSSIAKKVLKNLEDELGLKLIKTVCDNNPETYDANGFKSFVGFGDNPPEFYNQISYFLGPKEIQLTLPVHKIIDLLKDKFNGETLLKSFVTSFNFTEGKVSHVTVNGSKEYYANNFIFAGATRDLVNLVSDDVLSARAKAKLKKDTAWVGLCLDLLHSSAPVPDSADSTTQAIEKNNLFILEGTTNDSIGPCVGRFLPMNLNEQNMTGLNAQVSQWISFIDIETSEETENIAEVLKKMKRQIKRAFPEMVDAIKAERLFMTSALSCGEIKLNSNGTLPKAENLWIASGQVNQYPNLLGSLLQAQFILSSLGFGEMNISSETATEAETI